VLRLRPFLCLWIAIALNAQFVAASHATDDRQESARILARSPQSAAVQGGSVTQRFENSKHRGAFYSAFALPASAARSLDRGQPAAFANRPCLLLSFIAACPTGRSPPLPVS